MRSPRQLTREDRLVAASLVVTLEYAEAELVGQIEAAAGAAG